MFTIPTFQESRQLTGVMSAGGETRWSHRMGRRGRGEGMNAASVLLLLVIRQAMQAGRGTIAPGDKAVGTEMMNVGLPVVFRLCVRSHSCIFDKTYTEKIVKGGRFQSCLWQIRAVLVYVKNP